MKLKSMEAWLKPALDAGQEIITYVGIRYDERGRIGYKPTNNLIKAKFPFIEDCIDKHDIIKKPTLDDINNLTLWTKDYIEKGALS